MIDWWFEINVFTSDTRCISDQDMISNSQSKSIGLLWCTLIGAFMIIQKFHEISIYIYIYLNRFGLVMLESITSFCFYLRIPNLNSLSIIYIFVCVCNNMISFFITLSCKYWFVHCLFTFVKRECVHLKC